MPSRDAGLVLETRDTSTAVVRLRSGASLAMSENSEVALDWADAAAGTERMDLHRGAINLLNPSPQAEWVAVPGASVLVQGEGGFPAICRLAAVGQSSAVINDRGHVEIRGSGAPVLLPRGQSAALEAGSPQGGGQEAGAVTAELPKGNVQHAGQPKWIPLVLNDNVYFKDEVKTEALGRVRIALKDGSLLNIGARSQMTINQHDAPSRQTTLELTAGKLRSKVQKLDPSNGQKFEVTTPTAVIGVVGTDFIVESQNNKDKRKSRTLVWCLEGSVKVRNLDAAIAGVVVLQAGEFTSVAFGQPPSAATTAPASEVQTQVSQTDVTGVSDAGAAGGVGGTGGAGGMGTLGTVANVGAAAAAGVGAATAGVAISRGNSASNLLNQAGSTLTAAASSSSSAVTSANSANQAATTAIGNLTGVLQELVSPTYPCGCH